MEHQFRQFGLAFNFRESFDMGIIEQRTHLVPSHFATISGGWIVLGYVAFAVAALAAIYLGSGGPGTSGDALALMAAMP